MTEEQLKTIIMNAHMAGQHSAGIDSSNYESLAYYNSLVKNLNMPVVSQRSEQLLDFINWNNENHSDYIPNSRIERYLQEKSSNCG